MIFRVLLILFCSSFAFSDCWDKVYKGNPTLELQCRFLDYEADPSVQNRNDFLQSLFFTYITNGENAVMRQFFDRLRSNDRRITGIVEHARTIASKYTFEYEQPPQAASIWTMQPRDAKILFLITQVHTGFVPQEILFAAYQAVYDEIEQYFYLKSAYEGSFGVLPAKEYLRLQEILRRMAFIQDPYMTALNHFYRGIINLNLNETPQASREFLDCRSILHTLLSKTEDTLAKKRILRLQAATSLLEGNLAESEIAYLNILKMDPNDWNALLELSYLLNRKGECTERGVWIEAYLKSGQDLFEIVLHCGNQKYPEQFFPTEPPAIAQFRHIPN